jgi:hypothetical protein
VTVAEAELDSEPRELPNWPREATVTWEGLGSRVRRFAFEENAANGERRTADANERRTADANERIAR